MGLVLQQVVIGFVEDTVILFVKTHVKDHVGVVVVVPDRLVHVVEAVTKT